MTKRALHARLNSLNNPPPLHLFPSTRMDKLSSLTRFKASCPFLGRTKTSTLRTLCTSASPRFPSLSVLTERATKCPVMGPALAVRSSQIAAGYASVAGSSDYHKIHQEKGIFPTDGAGVEMCPHASAARNAARVAEDVATAATASPKEAPSKAPAAGCPYHQPAPADTTKPTPAASTSAASTGGFAYEQFYVDQLEKKHKDNSYRYFNNINRLAKKFPIAHTADVRDEVQVWCANDYLGMGNNPVVLETMQYVATLFFFLFEISILMPFFSVELSINTATVPAVPAISQVTAPCI